MNATAEKHDEAISPEQSKVLFGRFMLPDMSENPCQVTKLTSTGATFLTEKVPEMGLPIVAYIEELGRIEAISGKVVPGGFHIDFSLKGSRLEKLETRIKWLGERPTTGEVGRKHARFEPRDSQSQITLPDGRVYNCEVVDISVTGAGIVVDVMPSLGTYVMLGKMRGRVVRYLESGVAIEFVKPIEKPALAVSKQ